MPGVSGRDFPIIAESPLVYLASASPRRTELLHQIGVTHVQLRPDVDELSIQGDGIKQRLLNVARAKAHAGIELAREFDWELPVLAADTAVVLNGEELGKPKDDNDAVDMLSRLSGNRHWVYTAVTILSGSNLLQAVGETEVWFAEMNEEEIADYIGSGEPMDKAGAYGIQGLGAKFVERINGSYSNVVGLPLFETVRLLRQAGVRV